jgi:LacI family transcriptional regulator
MKAVTIKDVAREAGVSISVVSYVLNDNPNVSITKETREKVLLAAKKLNYTPNRIARSMRTKKSMIIGLATFWDVSDSVFTDVLKGVDQVSEKYGYSVTYCNLRNSYSGNKIIELYNQKQIDGVILLLHVDPAENFDEIKFLNTIKRGKIPAVVVNGSTEDPDISYVNIDYHGTSYTAVNYLHNLGHRRFSYMLPNKNEVDNKQALQRVKGYKAALESLDLTDTNLYFDEESISDIIRLIKQDPSNKPTAVVANKTRYAASLLRAFNENGVKVPEDISVIACNDQEIAEFLTPALTTIKVPIYTIGVKSAEMLFDILNGKPINIKLKLSNEVIERKSCRKVLEPVTR